VGSVSDIGLIRTDTTLDQSQKAEKVWRILLKPANVFRRNSSSIQATNLSWESVTGETVLTLVLSKRLGPKIVKNQERHQKVVKNQKSPKTVPKHHELLATAKDR
jgi:hypothetical protein